MSLVVLAVFSSPGCFGAEDLREAERVEWVRVQEYQRATAIWGCFDIVVSLPADLELAGDHCIRVFAEAFDRPLDFVNE